MKVNELEIGDILTLNGAPVRVKGLYARDGRDGVAYEWADGKTHGDIAWVDASAMEPIPITQELLATNGWDASAYSTLKLEDSHWLEYYHFENRLCRWWSGVDEWQNHAEVKELVFLCHCRYVHELQHALRMMLQNSLADMMYNATAKSGEE